MERTLTSSYLAYIVYDAIADRYAEEYFAVLDDGYLDVKVEMQDSDVFVYLVKLREDNSIEKVVKSFTIQVS